MPAPCAVDAPGEAEPLSASQLVLTRCVWLAVFALMWGLGFTAHSLQQLAEYRAAAAVAAERRQRAIELHDTVKHDLARMRMLNPSMEAKNIGGDEVRLLDEQVQRAAAHLSGLLGVLSGRPHKSAPEPPISARPTGAVVGPVPLGDIASCRARPTRTCRVHGARHHS